jgi:hypothetical protein
MLTKLNINLKIDTYLRQLSLKSKNKINNAVHFSTNLILNDEIKNKKIKNN